MVLVGWRNGASVSIRENSGGVSSENFTESIVEARCDPSFGERTGWCLEWLPDQQNNIVIGLVRQRILRVCRF